MTIVKKTILSVLVLGALVSTGVFASGNRSAAPSASVSATTTPVGTYPVSTSVGLSYWSTLNANVSPHYTNFGDTPFAKALQQQTGIKITYQHPPETAVTEAFNLMIVDPQNMPNIIEYYWLTQYPGGPEKAISDGVILRLNDYIDRYAPNYKAFLQAHPDLDKMVKTDQGSYYVFAFLKDDERLLNTQGLMIRKDWLDDLGLALPTTIDDWHNVLTQFKTQKGASAPFTITWSNNLRLFMPSFGFLKSWYVNADDGKVHFGQYDAGYRQWLQTMAQWYKEGLIDPDVVSVRAASTLNTNMTTGKSGAAVASVGSGLQTWMNAMTPTQPKYEVVALPYPALTRNAKAVYGIPGAAYSGQDSAAISAASTPQQIEIACRLLDYAYSEKGHILYNFGIEGESFTMVNGVPTYTPLIMKNPQGWSISQAILAYSKGAGSGPFVQDINYLTQYYSGVPQAASAPADMTIPGADKYLLPPVTATSDESAELASITTDVNTYVDEFTTNVVIGNIELTDAAWNKYLSDVRGLGIERALAIQNAALDRYNKR
ncbi:MAG: extracellular solute-binding protein [Treponema sp.]|jgi:putative aldouronate transport system substrate-binding protein|nr:extracellular solute-binding protein [Treponema sp.]